MKDLTLALCASLLLVALGSGIFWAGTRTQLDHDRQCLQTNASWSDVMGCMEGKP